MLALPRPHVKYYTSQVTDIADQRFFMKDNRIRYGTDVFDKLYKACDCTLSLALVKFLFVVLLQFSFCYNLVPICKR